MFRNAYQRQWAVVSVICLLAISAFVLATDMSSAGEVPPRRVMVAKAIETEMAPDCPLPVPAPACTAGQTICSEGNGAGTCHATVYTCGGTPPVWGTGTQCNYNSCTGTPGSVGSKCQ